MTTAVPTRNKTRSKRGRPPRKKIPRRQTRSTRSLYEVCLMENNRTLLGELKRTLRECGWVPRSVSTPEDVERVAKAMGIHYFILDIDMGDDNPRAGIDALEKLKDLKNPMICVAIYSSYLGRIEELSDDIQPDIVVPKGKVKDIAGDCARILDHFLGHAHLHLRQVLEQYHERFPGLVADRRPFVTPLLAREEAPNFPATVNDAAFDQLDADANFVSENAGRYATFVDGALNGVYDGREEGLAALREFPGKARMIARIGPPEDELDFPGLYDIDL